MWGIFLKSKNRSLIIGELKYLWCVGKPRWSIHELCVSLVLPLPLTSCVPVSKTFNSSELLLPHLKKRGQE